jgi:hypothetical protein
MPTHDAAKKINPGWNESKNIALFISTQHLKN